jgi:prepilin-type N-terminal cleavage/methylation domain-containing protein
MTMTRNGFTLVELMVVLVLIGAIASMVGLSIRDVPPQVENSSTERLFAARQQALRAGTIIVVSLSDSANALVIAAQPDGSVIADSAAGIDRFTGRAAPDTGVAR